MLRRPQAWRPWTPRPRYLLNPPYLTWSIKATIKATTPSEAEVHTKAERPIFNAKSERSYWVINNVHKSEAQLPIDGSTIKAHSTYHTRVCHDYRLEGVF